MTPQALGKARTFPSAQQAEILALRRNGKTIMEICQALAFEGNAQIAAVQNLCLQHFGKRDLRGPEIGALPGKTKSYRRSMAP